MNREQHNARFVRAAAVLVRHDMTQDDYDKLRDIAGILNPSGNGYVRILNNDVAKLAPHITRR
jgi:hypothetical protein